MDREGLRLTEKLMRLGMASSDAKASAAEAIGNADRICTGRRYSKPERWALLQYLCYPACSGHPSRSIELPALRLREALSVDVDRPAYLVTLRKPMRAELVGDGIDIGSVCGISVLASVNEWSSCRCSGTLNAALFDKSECGDDSILLCGQTVYQQILPAGLLLYLEARRIGRYIHRERV